MAKRKISKAEEQYILNNMDKTPEELAEDLNNHADVIAEFINNFKSSHERSALVEKYVKDGKGPQGARVMTQAQSEHADEIKKKQRKSTPQLSKRNTYKPFPNR